MIKTIRIRNFRSIEDVTVSLEPVTVLVGRSGTGKSNFVKALRFLRDFLLNERPGSVVYQHDELIPAFSPEVEPAFDVDFEIDDVAGGFRYSIQLIPKSNMAIREESLARGDTVLFHQSCGDSYRWETEPSVTTPPSLGDVALRQLQGVPEVALAHTALTFGIGCYEFPAGVMTAEFTDDSGAVRNGLSDTGSNYLDIVRTLSSDLHAINTRQSIASALQRINASVASIEPNSLTNPTKLIVSHDFDKRQLPLELSHESDGFRRFYAHLLALYQQPAKQTLVFEHPEDGIYPGALSLLAEEFRAAHEAKRGQVILTTHSPGLLDHFRPEEIRVVELEKLRTRIGPMVEEQREAIQDNLLGPGELLTVDPARAATSEAAGA